MEGKAMFCILTSWIRTQLDFSYFAQLYTILQKSQASKNEKICFGIKGKMEEKMWKMASLRIIWLQIFSTTQRARRGEYTLVARLAYGWLHPASQAPAFKSSSWHKTKSANDMRSLILYCRGLASHGGGYFSTGKACNEKSFKSSCETSSCLAFPAQKRKNTFQCFFFFVPGRGLEPPRVTPPAPKAGASTISPSRQVIIY